MMHEEEVVLVDIFYSCHKNSKHSIIINIIIEGKVRKPIDHIFDYIFMPYDSERILRLLLGACLQVRYVDGQANQILSHTDVTNNSKQAS